MTDAEQIEEVSNTAVSFYNQLEETRRQRFENRELIYEGFQSLYEEFEHLPPATKNYLSTLNKEKWGLTFRKILHTSEAPEFSDTLRYNKTLKLRRDNVEVEKHSETETRLTFSFGSRILSAIVDAHVSEFSPRDEQESIFLKWDESEGKLGVQMVGSQGPTTVDEGVPEPLEGVTQAANRIRSSGEDYTDTLYAIQQALEEYYSPKSQMHLMLVLAGIREAASINADPAKKPLIDAICNVTEAKYTEVPGLSDFFITTDPRRLRLADSLANDVDIDGEAYEYLVGTVLGYPQEFVEYFVHGGVDTTAGPMRNQAAYMTLDGRLSERDRFHFTLPPYTTPGNEQSVWMVVGAGRRYESGLKNFDAEHGVSVGEETIDRVYEETFNSWG